MSAYATDESQLLGHLDVSKSKDDWSSLTLCPPRYNNDVQDKYLSFSGTPNLAFTVQIDSSPQEIKLNEPQTFQVPPPRPETVRVFQFIPNEDISDTQLDVTVTSESADVPAYLKISRDCKDVKDNIDYVDYKGESLRLSFAKKGRITLSKVSVPPLTDSTSRLFIGIAIKNATGNTPTYATKNVTLELRKSFDYSYAKPILSLVALSIFSGILISIFAICCLKKKSTSENTMNTHKEPQDINQEQGGQSSTNESESSTNVTETTRLVEREKKNTWCDVLKQWFTRGSKTFSYCLKKTPTSENTMNTQEELQDINQEQGGQSSTNESESSTNVTETTRLVEREKKNTWCDVLKQWFTRGPKTFSYCLKKTPTSENTMNTQEELQDINQEQGGQSSTNESESSGCDVLKQWFTRGPKTFSYTTAIVGFVLMIGAGQFVFANWHLMIEEGDRDNCYYNDFCYRVSDYADIPLNLMISNLVYIIHGLILALSVGYKEAKWLDRYRKREKTQKPMNRPANRNKPDDDDDLPPKQAFSIGYAFAWALIFEGSFSLVYHLCPSKLTFQFDTAFMFVIAGFTVILLYNGIGIKERSEDGTAESPIGAGNFFLYFLVPLYIFDYFGTLRYSEMELFTPLEIPFFVALALWLLCISIWTLWKLFVSKPRTCKELLSCKVFLLLLGVSAPVFSFCYWRSNLPQAFLFACIAESVIASLGTGICLGKKCECSFSGGSRPSAEEGAHLTMNVVCKDNSGTSKIKRFFQDPPPSLLLFFQFVYVVIMGLFWGFALNYFLGKPTTDKVETPENSRNLNHDCVWLGFFDYHDIWHIWSSHGLLMMVYFVMFISSESECQQEKCKIAKCLSENPEDKGS